MASKTMDYGNLKKQGESAKANMGWKPLVEDTFPCVYLGGEDTETAGRNGKKKRPVFVHSWRINRKSDEFMHKKVIKIRYIKDIDFQVERFLVDMIDVGVDLDKLTCDGDWEDVFDDMEEERVKANIKIFYQDTDKDEDGNIIERAFPEIRIQDVIQGLSADSEWAVEGGWVPAEDDSDDEAPKKKKKKTKAKKPKKVEAEPEVEVEEEEEEEAVEEKPAPKKKRKKKVEPKPEPEEAPEEEEEEEPAETEDPDTDDDDGEDDDWD